MGDVCGKGPDAAAVTALARYTLRAAAMRDRLPSRSLRLLNEALLRQRDDRRFCTVAYAYLETVNGGARVGFASGGHPLPLLLRADGAVEPVGAPGTLLGVVPDPRFEDTLDVARPGRRAGVLHRRGDRGPGRHRRSTDETLWRRCSPTAPAWARTPSPPAWRRRRWPDPARQAARRHRRARTPRGVAETTRSSTRACCAWRPPGYTGDQVGSLTSPMTSRDTGERVSPRTPASTARHGPRHLQPEAWLRLVTPVGRRHVEDGICTPSQGRPRRGGARPGGAEQAARRPRPAPDGDDAPARDRAGDQQRQARARRERGAQGARGPLLGLDRGDRRGPGLRPGRHRHPP